MKIVQINATCGAGSTGKICVAVSKLLNENGVENYIFYSLNQSDYEQGIKYMSSKQTTIQAIKSHAFGNYGFNSKGATKKLIKKLEEISPDIIHLHNLHSHNVDLTLLFNYIKERKIKIFWTFHDCWAFTGYCPHFFMTKCYKWQTGCNECPQRKEYSWFFDKSAKLYEKKKSLFSGLDMTIITPSQWLADLVKQSFLKDYPVKVINNGINLEVFKPTEGDFVKKYSLEDKKIILGVAFGWGRRKGLDVFVELAKRLPENYQIVLVGTSDDIDKMLPNNIISIHRTQNQQQLAEIYTASSVLVNPTREENYPTVNMESIACGTPVITFNTGGSPEILNENTGSVVDIDDVDTLEMEIIRVCETEPFSKEDCLERAKSFNEIEKFSQYVELYTNI
ncbi:MAG: glycosyltransferase [Clostridia bacterium]|nr:glycosyltransferase [Clostridia bacterium]